MHSKQNLLPAVLALLCLTAIASGDNWPRFRGPGGLGIAGPGTWPVQVNTETGGNILWKTPVPLKGESSPIVWGDIACSFTRSIAPVRHRASLSCSTASAPSSTASTGPWI